jgi:hypothetical protein
MDKFKDALKELKKEDVQAGNYVNGISHEL